jgi:uncharacterized protein
VPSAEPGGVVKPCPICGRPRASEVAPFCSKRCADIDLHRWLGGVYAVPTEEPDIGDGPLPGEDDDR